MLKFPHRMRPRKIQIAVGAGQEGRIKRLRQIVTGLVRYERVEPTYAQADEARQYAERLLYLAIKNGDKHKETMEMADYWLLEKDLVHKLFKVLVPRYKNYTTCFTDLHKLAVEYPGSGLPRAVLELRGNPWPPIVPRQRDTRYLLSNILLAGARKDYHISKQKAWEQQQQQQQETSSATLKSSSSSSSVDSGIAEIDREVRQEEGSPVDEAAPSSKSSSSGPQSVADR
ncbi:39S ribosomal protein l17, mitochondrial-like [Plakobranchus ocellatus]|uniref:Large ribosomal subunit protein bL17m n=1 Tax=Plakobranchus ocellatus TaxID=259542 RepID=A0AAV3ZY55_9GAST|nr:39S ribosomal protein l17, mitochondrial-like [Plakobranchus ocellatus]